jgi:hypothetical protein
MSTVPETMSAYLKEASELRYGVVNPPSTADMSELLQALQDFRARLDRIEYLLTSAVLSKGKTARSLRKAKDDLNDKWDDSLIRSNDRKAANLVAAQQFEAPREKYASANLATFEYQRFARAAEDDHSWTETTVDALQKMYRGLDSARQDLLTRIKAIPMVNSLEYTS